MKLLLDESIPRQLAAVFPVDIETVTVPQMGCAGSKNGDLLRDAVDAGFDALITADQGIENEQNPSTLRLRIGVLIAPRTRLQELEPLVPRVVDLLQRESAIGV